MWRSLASPAERLQSCFTHGAWNGVRGLLMILWITRQYGLQKAGKKGEIRCDLHVQIAVRGTKLTKR